MPTVNRVMGGRRKSTGGRKKSSKKKTGKKRSLNPYFKAMLKAKQENADSFVYKNKEGKSITYKRVKCGHMWVYEKK